MDATQIGDETGVEVQTKAERQGNIGPDFYFFEGLHIVKTPSSFTYR
jgi:hypothetical protein